MITDKNFMVRRIFAAFLLLGLFLPWPLSASPLCLAPSLSSDYVSSVIKEYYRPGRLIGFEFEIGMVDVEKLANLIKQTRPGSNLKAPNFGFRFLVKDPVFGDIKIDLDQDLSHSGDLTGMFEGTVTAATQTIEVTIGPLEDSPETWEFIKQIMQAIKSSGALGIESGEQVADQVSVDAGKRGGELILPMIREILHHRSEIDRLNGTSPFRKKWAKPFSQQTLKTFQSKILPAAQKPDFESEFYRTAEVNFIDVLQHRHNSSVPNRFEFRGADGAKYQSVDIDTLINRLKLRTQYFVALVRKLESSL